MDKQTATRHVMQANRSKDTGPELQVRHALRDAGLSGYRLHWKKASGRPDISYPGRKLAIFVNGCYWHRCPWCSLPMPKTNPGFWEEKFARNRARDQRNHEQLASEGWRVLVVWECRLKRGRFDSTMRSIIEQVKSAGDSCGQIIEVGAPEGWRVSAARRRLRRRRRK